MSEPRFATIHVAYFEVDDADGGGPLPSWNVEVLLDGEHVSTHGGQMAEAVLSGAADVLNRRVAPAEPHVGFPTNGGFDFAARATKALRERAGLGPS